jgi:hypothetical protein
LHEHVRDEPQPGSTGGFTMLHSAPGPPPPEHAGAAVQQLEPEHVDGATHLSQV